jgi:hypothetical protein
MKTGITRKEFLRQFSVIGASLIGSGSILTYCKKSEQKAEDPCADLSGLTEDEISLRKEFEYVAESPYPEKLCSNCGLWIEPIEGEPCGGCEIIAGPFHPNGYCTAWIEMG